jgi:hypothetical protein
MSKKNKKKNKNLNQVNNQDIKKKDNVDGLFKDGLTGNLWDKVFANGYTDSKAEKKKKKKAERNDHIFKDGIPSYLWDKVFVNGYESKSKKKKKKKKGNNNDVDGLFKDGLTANLWDKIFSKGYDGDESTDKKSKKEENVNSNEIPLPTTIGFILIYFIPVVLFVYSKSNVYLEIFLSYVIGMFLLIFSTFKNRDNHYTKKLLNLTIILSFVFLAIYLLISGPLKLIK